MSVKNEAQGRLDGITDELIALSQRIHDNPELGYEEEKA